MTTPELKLSTLFDGLTHDDPRRIFDLQFSTSGKQLFVAGGFDGKIAGRPVKRRNLACVNTTDGTEVWSVQETRKRPLVSLALLEESGHVVTTSSLGEATIRDAATGEIVVSLPEQNMVSVAACGSDGFLACGSLLGRHWVGRFDSRTGAQQAEWVVGEQGAKTPDAVITNTVGDLACALVSVAGERAMSGEVVFLSTAQLQPTAVTALSFCPVDAVFLATEHRLAVLGRHANDRDYVVALVDAATATIAAEIVLKKTEVMRIAYAPWLQAIVLLRKDTIIELRDPQRLQLISASSPLLPGDHAGFALALHPLGMLAIGDFGSTFGGGGFGVFSLPAAEA